jgi:hypothetical protein
MNAGQLFEQQLIASVPKWASVQKMFNPTPPPRELWSLKGPDGGSISLVELIERASKRWEDVGQACDRLPFLGSVAPFDQRRIAEWLYPVINAAGWAWPSARSLTEQLDKIRTALDRTTFTAKPPYDLEIKVPGAKYQPLTVCLECKSAGRESRIPFSMVKDNQRKGLLKAADGGALAAIAVEFPALEPDGEVYVIPIRAFLLTEEREERSSLSLSLARAAGTLLPVDRGRGKKLRYFDVANFLIMLGAKPPAAVEPEQRTLLEVR